VVLSTGTTLSLVLPSRLLLISGEDCIFLELTTNSFYLPLCTDQMFLSEMSSPTPQSVLPYEDMPSFVLT